MRWRLGHPIIPGNKLHVATAFPRGTLRFRIAQKILQRFEHQRTEAPASWIGALQKLTFKQHDKKILCQASLDLTTCETEVLTWIAQGKTNYEDRRDPQRMHRDDLQGRR